MDDSKPLDQSTLYLLGQIDAKVTHLLASLAMQKEDLKAETDQLHSRVDANSARITRIEHSHWRAVGVLSIIPVSLTALGLGIAYFSM